jgi:signal peptidase I
MAAPADGQEVAERVELRFPVAAREQSAWGAALELAIVVAVALGLAWFVQHYVARSYRIPTGSMRTTVDEGDRVLAARFVGWFSDPERGDVLVFHPPGVGEVAQQGATTQAEVTFIKRVIGLPGETLQGIDNHVLICTAPRVGCRRLQEPYVTGITTDFGPVTLAHDTYFMMGDNRQSSDDSRDWGPLARGNVIGTAFVRYWPLRRFGIL